MKRIKLTKLWKISLALFISLTSITALINSTDLLANEEFAVNETITMNEDNTNAKITLDTKDTKERYKIQSIQNPDGTMMDIENDPSYIVDENGMYTFIVNYIDMDSENKEELIYSKEVEVTQIKIEETKEETQATDKVETKQPRTITSSNLDSLTVEFEKDNTANVDWTDVSQVDWNYYDTEKVVITAVFAGKGNNKTREIEIDVPDGYQIIGYSAKNGSESQDGESILSTTEEVQQAMETSTLTSQSGGDFGDDKVTGYKTGRNVNFEEGKKSGKIKYVFNSEAETIILTLQLGIDKKMYNYSDTRQEYSDAKGTTSVGVSTGQLLDNLKVKQVSGTEVLEETVKANVKATLGSMNLHGTNSQNKTYIDDNNFSPIFSPYGTTFYYASSINSFNMLIDEVVMTYTYPEGASFIEFEGETDVTKAGNMTYINDTGSRTLTVSYTKLYATGTIPNIARPLFQLDGNIFGVDGGKLSTAAFKSTMATRTFGNNEYFISNSTFNVAVTEKDIPLVCFNLN